MKTVNYTKSVVRAIAAAMITSSIKRNEPVDPYFRRFEKRCKKANLK